MPAAKRSLPSVAQKALLQIIPASTYVIYSIDSLYPVALLIHRQRRFGHKAALQTRRMPATVTKITQNL